MALTAQTLARCGVPAAKARAHLPHIASAMREHEITTPLRARMFLAQVMHESAALRYFEEIASGAAYEGRRDLGNVRPGDGRRFKGRGPIQLTGRSNYTLFGKLLGLDLAGHPALAATPRVGWRVAALYFQRRGCNAAADRRDFAGVTRLINGGMNGYADRVRYYKLLGGAAVLPGQAFVGRGDSGDAVVTMTRRLSFVRDASTGRRYLDGKRTRFDAEAEKALRAFQADHRLEVDGRYGPRSARVLARATAAEKRRRAAARERRADTPPPERPARAGRQAGDRAGGTTRTGGTAVDRAGRATRGSRPAADRAGAATRASAVTAGQLLAGLDRLDARGDRLRAALIERRRVLERALARERSLSGSELDELGEMLGRLDAVVHEVEGAIAAAKEPTTVKVGDAMVTQAAPGVGELDELTDRLVALDIEEDRIRALLTERFGELERKVAAGRARRRGGTATAREAGGGTATRRFRRPATGGRSGAASRGGSGGATTGGRTATARTGRAPTGRRGAGVDDGRGGAAATLAPGSRSFAVRQSKLALARYLRRHRRETTRPLRRTLLVEIRKPKTARLATPAWQRAVREAQGIAGLPVTGRLDPRLVKALRRDWPTESAMRRVVRGTPAWRLIRGQLSPNFNLREFDCNDGTSYVAGLMREQRLTKAQAKHRAKQLADRLERLRAREGNRVIHLNSAFRTRAHNAKVGGVSNSAHTRGYAADIRPPAGVSIAAHRAHVRKVFEGGVGLYATFVHGDFAPEERGQNWTG